MQKKAHILLIILVLATVAAFDFDPNFSYDDFTRNFPRTYEGEVRERHQEAFNKNYAELLRLKKEGHDVQINHRLDWTQDQLNAFLTYRPEKSKTPFSTRPTRISSLFASPTAFDWRAYNRVSPVKDQGGCGSCWAFASTGQYESMLAIATNGTIYDLSEQYGLQCDTISSGCNGGYPDQTLRLYQNTGVPSETDYPYTPYSYYPNICTNTTGRVKINQTVNAVNFFYFQSLTVEQLQQDLVTYGPIGVGVWASDASFNYAGASGLISCAPQTSINHAILLVGYNATHWFVKNSWGTSFWGHNGFGYINKSLTNDCNIRQYVSEMQVSFGFNPVPDSNIVNLTITMTDSGNDGWNGNILNLIQDNSVLGTFGNSFTTGGSSGPVYITANGKSELRVAVSTLGTKTNQVGFIIKASNGTILFQRTAGTTFTATTIFSTVCVLGGCPVTLLLTVTMTDSGNDGWNSNIFGIKQNKTIVGNFGGAFTAGGSSGPVFISVVGNLGAQLVLTQLGTKTNEVGFVIKAPNGTTIFTRASGTTFDSNTYFTIFCPIGGCPNTLDLIITMTDTASNGWNGNVLAIKQGNMIMGTFGANFTTGNSSGPVCITVLGNNSALVVVSQLGLNTHEIGFVIKAPNGTIIFQRTSGSLFPSGFIFSIFCPVGLCPALTAYTTLTINMTDSFGDGWNDNRLAMKQNNIVVGFFGLATGASATFTMVVQGNITTQIIVIQQGTKSNQIGFVVKAANGTVIYTRTNGTTFDKFFLFSLFCPVSGCTNYLTLTVTMTDSGSDGWNGNVLGIRQLNENNNVMGTFGGAFTTGATSGPLTFNVFGNYQTQIIVLTLGIKTNEIGFVVKAPNGTVIFTRTGSAGGPTFGISTIFTTFCPLTGCSNLNASWLTINMVDATGDGWNGNVLAIKQNDTIVGTFGSLFTGGPLADPVYLLVQGNISADIVVSQFGSDTLSVGFTVSAPNGTLIYSRYAQTSTYDAYTTFTSFCLLGGCPVPPVMNLSITMTDSFGDGWNGNILAIKQNTTIVGTFGADFTTGYSSGPVFIAVQSNIIARIIVSTYGSWTAECGFTVKAPNGTIIFQRVSGAYFSSTTIFYSFCPGGSCPSNPNITYYLTKTDSYGDGWQGTVLGFKQGGTFISTFTLASGYYEGPIAITIPQYLSTNVVVYILGNYTNQVGLYLVDGAGNSVFTLYAGTKFFSNTLLGSFCPECTNLAAVAVVENRTEIRKEETKEPVSDVASDGTVSKGYLIATYVLAAVFVLTTAGLLFYILKLRKDYSALIQKEAESTKAKQFVKNAESSKTLFTESNMTK